MTNVSGLIGRIEGLLKYNLQALTSVKGKSSPTLIRGLCLEWGEYQKGKNTK